MTTRSQNCCWNGCAETGEYPAPRLRQMPVSFDSPMAVADDVPLVRDFYCLEHIRAFNKSWDFFKGMTETEIQAFQKDAVTGHRRTQKIQPHVVAEGYRTARRFRVGKETSATRPKTVPDRALTAEEREALAVFGLEYPATEATIKRRYRELVKQHHPDRVGVAGEEKIKTINHAYTCLQAVAI